MRRARQNPVDLNPLKLRIEEVVSKAMSVLITDQRATMPFWQKVEKTGPLAAEMELMRLFAGEWQRKAPYGNVRSLTIEVPSYLAFTYCAERANRAAGNHQIADAFWYIRHTDNVKNALEERPAKGGLKALIISTRKRLSQVPVFCTEDQLDFQRPEDALVFARSSMWGAYGGTGWKQVVDPLVRKHTKKAARRGSEVTGTQIKSGITAAGGHPVGESFVRADLRDADLAGANFRDADLTGANLTDANLTSANLINTNLTRTNLSGVNLKSAYLSGKKLSGANLTNADLRGANLTNADLRGAKLIAADLQFAHLSGAFLVKADLENANLMDAVLKDTNLEDANLRNANLRSTTLRTADLRNADLRGANLSNANLRRANLSNADLRGANLSNTDLEEVSLSGANLSGANLSDANRRASDPAIPGWRVVSGYLQPA